MVRHFSRFIVNISLPALLFTSFQRPYSIELLREGGIAFVISIFIYAMAFLIAWVYPKILGMKGPERGVHRYSIIISNCGYMGYPLVEAVLGPAFLFHAVIFNIPFSLLAFSVCAWLIAKEGNQSPALNWKTFVNPNVAATFLGIVFFLLSISLPDPLYRSLKPVGDMASPLMMISIGVTLSQANFRQVFSNPRIYVTTAARLIIIPVIVGLILYFFGVLGLTWLQGPLFIMAVLITAMPAGSSASLLASLYKIAPEEASSLVFLSTMLSIITIPVIIQFANFLNH